MHINVLQMLRVLQLQLILAAISYCQELDLLYQNDLANDNTNNNLESSKKLEDTVVHGMLKIVDNKFDTLTTRITALERAVSGLQFFSIRQFQRLSGSVQKTQDNTLTIGKKVSQLETDGRGLKIAMSLLNRDISELKSTTTDVLAELESSVIYINDNVDKQSQVLKNALEDEANKIVMATDELLIRQTDQQLSRERKKEHDQDNKAVNCSMNFSHLHERFDVRLEDFKQDLVSNYFNPMIEMQLQFQEFSSSLMENNSKEMDKSVINQNRKHSQPNTSEEIYKSSQSGVLAQEGPVEERTIFKNSSTVNAAKNEEDVVHKNKFEENDERLMNLLINMTNSVLQSQSYFRQSGGLMEEILANTYDLNKGQEILKTQLQSLINSESATDDEPRENNDTPIHADRRSYSGLRYLKRPIPDAKKYNLYKRVSPEESSTTRSPPSNCGIPSSVLDELVTVFKNGSQLLGILTDLAQMSSTSLAKATGSLQDEISRMEDVRKAMATSLLGHPKGISPQCDITAERFDNATQKIQQAVDSNTGWMRLIYRSNQHIETLTNRSLLMTKRNYKMLLKNHKHKLMLFDLAHKARSKSREMNEVTPSKNDGRDNNGALSISGLKEDLVLDKESLEMMYSTSVQLNRIMPALTKLLAEPDPLITLVDGNGDDQGRLEIYNKGQWGTICHKDLTNEEADVVCRHLGYLGGFSAGAGYFGPGTGVAWTLNMTCFDDQTVVCTAVELLTDMSLCDHEKDVGIICDHMLRIVALNDTLPVPKSGRLEILHQGLWLPVCGEGWSGFSARVACKQMGFVDGRELLQEPWTAGANSTWLNKVACNGQEPYLDACDLEGWSDTCKGSIPAGVRCL